MAHGNIQTMHFNGILLRRDYTLGQKFVRLVFRENNEDILCISANIQDSRWEVGEQYRVKGVVKHAGEHVYVQNPQIARPKQRWVVAKRALISTMVLAALAGIGTGAYLFGKHMLATSPVAPQAMPVSAASTSVAGQN